MFLLFLSAQVFFESEIEKITFLVSSFGFVSLLSILFVLAIPLLVRFGRNPLTMFFLVNRRWIGIYTFVFALLHVLVVSHFFLGWDWRAFVENPAFVYLLLGLFAFFILFAMALTSNDISMRVLGRSWKRLHYCVYATIILVLIHAGKLAQLFMANRIVASVVVILASLIIGAKIFFVVKKRFMRDTANKAEEGASQK